jgi:hypothetical protein
MPWPSTQIKCVVALAICTPLRMVSRYLHSCLVQGPSHGPIQQADNAPL